MVSRTGSEFLYSALYSMHQDFKAPCKIGEIFADTAVCQQAAGLQGTQSMARQLFTKENK